MKNKKQYIGIVAILFILLLFGCENFEEINTNPNSTTEVTPTLLCPKVLLEVLKFNVKDASELVSGNALPKYLGRTNTQLETQYNKIVAGSMNDFYILPNIDELIYAAEGSVAKDFYKGVAKFTRAYHFFYYTMMMGDIPYSDAGQGDEGVTKPKYDVQEEIFIGVLDELIEADAYFAASPSKSSLDIEIGDPSNYAGDAEKWRKATNAFALKILMSLSEKTDVASLDVKNRFAEIVAAGNLMQEETDYLGLEYYLEQKYPLYSASGRPDVLVSSLVIDNLKKLSDRRLYYYAEPAGAVLDSLQEIDSTITEADPNAYIGVDVSIDYALMRANHNEAKYSILNKRYSLEYNCEPRRLITYAEQQFILAEAVLRGWITGSAEEYFKQGVKAAIVLVKETEATEYAHGMEIDQEYLDDLDNNYFTGNGAFASTTDEQLKQIWIQRYLLNFIQDNRGAFFEYRRTTHPEFPINSETSLNETAPDKIPMRWLYPSSEYSYNHENVVEALMHQFGSESDDINNLMWILAD